MISIYVLYVMLFPVAALWNMKVNHDKTQENLLSRNDTMYLRGVAACFVLLGHFCIWLNESAVVMNREFYFIYKQLGGIGVLIFFFVSGYGIYESYANRSPTYGYLIKRGGAVYFPYLIIKICLLLLEYVVGMRHEIMVKDVLSILVVNEWFIHVILLQYLFFWIIWKFIGSNKIIVYSIVADFIMSVLYVIQNKPERWFNALWLFTFGMVCSLYKAQIIAFFKKHTWIRIFWLILGFLVIGTLFAFNKGGYWANVFKPIAGAFLCVAICGVMICMKFASPIMCYFGKRSMYLYIVHINVWPAINMEEPIKKFWVALFVSIILTEILYTIVQYNHNYSSDRRLIIQKFYK